LGASVEVDPILGIRVPARWDALPGDGAERPAAEDFDGLARNRIQEVVWHPVTPAGRRHDREPPTMSLHRALLCARPMQDRLLVRSLFWINTRDPVPCAQIWSRLARKCSLTHEADTRGVA